MNIIFAPFAAKLPNKSSSPKDYPYAVRLNELLEQAGHQVLQVGSSQDMQIAKQIERGRSFKELGEIISECDTGICVDSFLNHAMWYFKKRGIVIWRPSDSKIFGHECHINLFKSEDYARSQQFECWTQTPRNPEAFVSPDIVMKTLDR